MTAKRHIGTIFLVGLVLLACVALGVYTVSHSRQVVHETSAGDTVAEAAVQAAPRPNVVLISIDTLRADHLGAYGAWNQQTPCLDRLARRGQQLVRMVSGASCTLSSHSTLLTSLFPQTHQADASTRNRLAPRFITLPEVLRDAGYTTGGFTAGGQLMDVSGINQGFDLYQGDLLPGKTIYKRAYEWLAQQSQDTPFFLFVHHYDVHHPYEGERAFFKLQAPGVPEGLNGSVFNAPNDQWRNYSDISGIDIHRMYRGAVDSTDRLVEELLRTLDINGQLDNTIVAVVSDHGEEFGERNWWASHGHSVYAEVIDVPCIIAGIPDTLKSVLWDIPAHGVDLMPTLLDMVDVQAPSAIEGRSLLRSSIDLTRKFFSQSDLYNLPQYRVAVESGTRKWIRQPYGAIELYDHSSDPGEWRNLVKRSDVRTMDSSMDHAPDGVSHATTRTAEGEAMLQAATYAFNDFWTEHLRSSRATRAEIPDPFPVTIQIPVLDRLVGTFGEALTLNPKVALKAWVDIPPGEYEMTLRVDPVYSGQPGETIDFVLGTGTIANKQLATSADSMEYVICPLQSRHIDEVITMNPATVTTGQIKLAPQQAEYTVVLTQKLAGNHQLIIDFNGTSRVDARELSIQPLKQMSLDEKRREELRSLGYIE